VTVELDSLLGRPGALGGEVGWAGPLAAEGCRRLACDGAVTRVLVTRHGAGLDIPLDHLGDHGHPHPSGHHELGGHQAQDDSCGHHGHLDPGGEGGLAEWLRTAAKLLPPVLGGAPTQPLDVGRTTRVVSPAQRTALAVRDGGCGFPGCDRPLAWCEAHHLVHWLDGGPTDLDGGPTDLDNPVLLCRAHHRAVHAGGWRLQRQPDGRLTATPPYRPNRRHHAAA